VLAALDRGDLEFIRAHAASLAPITLPDALRICLMVRDQEPTRYEAAAVRWVGRFALEARDATLEDLRRVAAALDALPQQPESAMEQLSRLCVQHHLPGC
jgi:uncharacterized lipoprotein YmbA